MLLCLVLKLRRESRARRRARQTETPTFGSRTRRLVVACAAHPIQGANDYEHDQDPGCSYRHGKIGIRAK
jgi:hypothetical protein